VCEHRMFPIYRDIVFNPIKPKSLFSSLPILEEDDEDSLTHQFPCKAAPHTLKASKQGPDGVCSFQNGTGTGTEHI
jgi:hypothetical protein